MSLAIEPGRRVTLHYSLSFSDGMLVDRTDPDTPASFVIGSGELVELLERYLLGMRVGERRHFDIPADDTRSMLDAGTVQHLPRSDFPPELELVPGQLIGFAAPNGQELPGLILAVNETEVAVDFSHPLAGRDLVFDVEILAVDPV
jgi:FKBP-type peptidyl-prolyl cis-trans isomerase SlpA